MRKAISPYLSLQASGCGAGDSMMWLMCLRLNFVRLSVCIRHVHVTKISIWCVYTKFKWRQFEYHSAIQSLKHLIWESWMMHYGHIYTAFCIIIKLKVMFWKLDTRIYFNVGTFKLKVLQWCRRSDKKSLRRDRSVFTTPFNASPSPLTHSYCEFVVAL